MVQFQEAHSPPRPIRVGVLALQGAFMEHLNMLKRIPGVAAAVPVRNRAQLASVDALIIPGGESTAIALVAERSGMFEPLREFVRTRPTWGTCAGLILLANEANRTKKGGQRLLGGLDIAVNRNQFGSQIDSFETLLYIKNVTHEVPCKPFPAVFIRAPVIVATKSADVEVLAKLDRDADDADTSTIVAVQQGHLLGTAFHPELTNDDRLHRYFIDFSSRYLHGETQANGANERKK